MPTNEQLLSPEIGIALAMVYVILVLAKIISDITSKKTKKFY